MPYEVYGSDTMNVLGVKDSKGCSVVVSTMHSTPVNRSLFVKEPLT
jgi:hypothetical protein